MSDEYIFSNPGDIAFVRESDWLSKSIILGQKALGRRGARFSHVLVCVANQIWAHATPETGVAVCSESQYFDQGRFEEIFVVRPHLPEIERGDRTPFEYAFAKVRAEIATADLWLANLFYFHSQAYDLSVGFSPISANRARYCSELVAKVYSLCLPATLPIGNRKRIFPHDLLQLTSKARFDDVTQLFLKGRETDAKLLLQSYPVEEAIKSYLQAAEQKLIATIAQIEALELSVETDTLIDRLSGRKTSLSEHKRYELERHGQVSWQSREAAERAQERIRKMIDRA
ncbi:hypothetical protein FHX06_001272 [Rhizobium sp. BK512]|uniref:hypothetical protein n=1 Tax=Rhizobium sp. BK512 TaxID=2587010 RepID=UPI001614AE4A|nr:hypothetical protein [Rhizobium sp. BK512]MBB3559961.1 hypothetical protein [Rhizobium sp. BK512]